MHLCQRQLRAGNHGQNASTFFAWFYLEFFNSNLTLGYTESAEMLCWYPPEGQWRGAAEFTCWLCRPPAVGPHLCHGGEHSVSRPELLQETSEHVWDPPSAAGDTAATEGKFFLFHTKDNFFLEEKLIAVESFQRLCLDLFCFEDSAQEQAVKKNLSQRTRILFKKLSSNNSVLNSEDLRNNSVSNLKQSCSKKVKFHFSY